MSRAGSRSWPSSQAPHSSWAGPEGSSLAREGGSVWFWGAILTVDSELSQPRRHPFWAGTRGFNQTQTRPCPWVGRQLAWGDSGHAQSCWAPELLVLRLRRLDATLGLAGVPTPGEAEGGARGLGQQSARAGGVEHRAPADRWRPRADHCLVQSCDMPVSSLPRLSTVGFPGRAGPSASLETSEHLTTLG